jgi:hypothetical protein
MHSAGFELSLRSNACTLRPSTLSSSKSSTSDWIGRLGHCVGVPCQFVGHTPNTDPHRSTSTYIDIHRHINLKQQRERQAGRHTLPRGPVHNHSATDLTECFLHITINLLAQLHIHTYRPKLDVTLAAKQHYDRPTTRQTHTPWFVVVVCRGSSARALPQVCFDWSSAPPKNKRSTYVDINGHGVVAWITERHTCHVA